jgi:ADP-ribose pyrophosphatase
MKKLSKIPPHARKVFSGVIFDIYQWDQEMYDGSVHTFESAARADAVSIIPVIDDQIVIIHEEQPGREANIGFPGGHIDPGEDPLTAARRELYEETGMTFKDLKLVAIEDIGGHKVDWACYRYIATGLVNRDEPRLDPGEKIVVEIVDFDKAKELAENNIYMSHMIMEQVDSLAELLALPEESIDE